MIVMYGSGIFTNVSDPNDFDSFQRRFSSVPVRGGLKHVGRLQKFFFAHRRTLKLQSDRQAALGKSARESDAP